YTVLRPTEKLIVVDMPGADGSKLSPMYPVKSGLVESIMVRGGAASGNHSSASRSDRVATRIELKVRGPLQDRSSLNGNALVLELSPAEAAGEQEQAPDQMHAASPGVYVYPVAVKADGSAGSASKPDSSSAGAAAAKNVGESAGSPATVKSETHSGA